MIDTATLEIIKNFDHLSDNQIVGPQVVQFLLGGAASRRHVRRELPIPRRWITARRFGFTVGDVRKLLRGEMLNKEKSAA
jgi:hypothetical protein